MCVILLHVYICIDIEFDVFLLFFQSPDSLISIHIYQFQYIYLFGFFFYLQSFDRIPETTHEFNEEDEDAFDEEEESKFCTLPRSNNGFTIRHVCIQKLQLS